VDAQREGVEGLTIRYVRCSGASPVVRLGVTPTEPHPFQKAFARAGHAHAGVLVTLSLVCLILADSADLSGLQRFFARNGFWAAAILMPAGFFLSSAGSDVTTPNRFVLLLYAGAISLALGAVCLGLGLL